MTSMIEIFGLLLVTGSLIASVFGIMRQVSNARLNIEQLLRQNMVASTTLRQIAKESLRLKRARAQQQERERTLTRECAEIEQAIATSRRTAAALIVLDERKGTGDGLWEVPVTRSARPGTPWRTFLVWAPSPERARLKVELRHPEGSGCVVGTPTARQSFPEAAQ